MAEVNLPEPARIAIDLGAESCRVSLLRFVAGEPHIEVIHRISNGPVRRGDSLFWPLKNILAGLEQGLRKAAASAPEGIASIAVDSWSVDYARLAPDGSLLCEPFCYRDERTVAAKQAADAILSPLDLFARTGAIPLRINTVYQLLADPASGIDPHAPWVMLPEYVLYWLSGRRVAEYTNASHTGLVNLKTCNWDEEVFREFGLPLEAAPPLVAAGTFLGPLQGPLSGLDAFRHTRIVAPATHDTASAVAGIPADLGSTSYLCTGTWSLMGTVCSAPVTTKEAFEAGYTNLGAATGGLCFHTLINGMWLLKQCMDGWAGQGRRWAIDGLVQAAAASDTGGRTIDVNAEPLMLELDMPARINRELARRGHEPIADTAGNEPRFARLIFESLAERYAQSLANLEHMLGRRLERIHMLGGANRNKLLVRLTEERTDRPVTVGETESSTIGNLAVQLAASEAMSQPVTAVQVRTWAARLCSVPQP
ncbi:MAG: rhamnulokinase [Acidobacteriota bacterium]